MTKTSSTHAAWFAVVVAVAIPGACGLVRAGGTEQKVENNTQEMRAKFAEHAQEIREMRGEMKTQGKDVAYIRGKIESFLEGQEQ